MRNVYLILTEQYMPEIENHTPMGHVEFAFSSEKQANNQIEKLVELIINGDWWAEGEHTIIEDYIYNKIGSFGIMRHVKVKHDNGTYTIYTLQKVVLNHGYGL